MRSNRRTKREEILAVEFLNRVQTRRALGRAKYSQGELLKGICGGDRWVGEIQRSTRRGTPDAKKPSQGISGRDRWGHNTCKKICLGKLAGWVDLGGEHEST